jgi:hypothetical protein
VIVDVYWHCISAAEWLGTCAEKLYVEHSHSEALAWLKYIVELVALATDQTIGDWAGWRCVHPW